MVSPADKGASHVNMMIGFAFVTGFAVGGFVVGGVIGLLVWLV